MSRKRAVRPGSVAVVQEQSSEAAPVDPLAAWPIPLRFPRYRSRALADALQALGEAEEARRAAERQIVGRVAIARSEGASWAAVGLFLGLTGDGARSKYGRATARRPGDETATG